ncbi:hypothetical protein Efla_002430 [Eimeria flavescens]
MRFLQACKCTILRCWLLRFLAAGIPSQVCRVAEPPVPERMPQQQPQRQKQETTEAADGGSISKQLMRATPDHAGEGERGRRRRVGCRQGSNARNPVKFLKTSTRQPSRASQGHVGSVEQML